jgi:RimJ/RimL family protein N-acetyltransferase
MTHDGGYSARRLLSSDAPCYRDLMLHAYENFSEAFTSTANERRAKSLSWWEERIASDDGSSVGFGAFDGEEMVGTAGIEYETRDKTKHKSLLFGMFVRPEYRGHGIGRALIDAALDHARSRPGSLVMQLALTGGNVSAQRLYEACGFTTFGVEPMGLCIEGGFRAKVHMWRAVAASVTER